MCVCVTGPWQTLNGWRSNNELVRELKFVSHADEHHPTEYTVAVTYHPDNSFSMKVKKSKTEKQHHQHQEKEKENEDAFLVKAEIAPNGDLKAIVGGEVINSRVVRDNNKLHVFHGGVEHEIELPMPKFLQEGTTKKSGLVRETPRPLLYTIAIPGRSC